MAQTFTLRFRGVLPGWFVAATIKEIAVRLDVSAATVSRAINGLPGVGDKMRRRILKAAREMGYVPDFNARALVSGKVPFLGLVVPDITNSFFPALALAAEEEASLAGYSLLLFNTNWRPDRLRQAFDLLASRRVAGLIFSEPIDEPGSPAFNLEPLASSVVFAGVEAPPGTGVCSVRSDDVDGGHQIGRHLVGRGVRTVAFVGGPEGSRASARRLEGLRLAIAESGAKIPMEIVSVTSGPWTGESGYGQASSMLRRCVPDAVFAANDLLAVGVMQCLKESGIATGRGMALAGYDDTPIVSMVSTPITSVAQPEARIGVEAVRRLLGQLETGEPAQGLLLGATLKPRASTLEFGSADETGTPVPDGGLNVA